MGVWIEKIRQYGLSAGLVLAGLAVIAMGGWQTLHQNQEEVIVEGTGTNEQGPENNLDKIYVDVAGAVKNPGVYMLEPNARVAQVLEKAGGFREEADGDWIAKMINQAEMVKDGQKIFIPAKGQENNEQKTMSNERSINLGTATVNVNTASKSELDSLWGIGEVRAEAILANRPFGSLEELKSKAGIPQDVIDKNVGKMSVY